MQLVTTGIQGLDAHFGGGVPKGSTVLVVSEPSNAPYLFNEQFAAGGLNGGETVFYYNLERPKDEVVEHLRGLLPKPEVVKNLQYFDCYSVKFKNLGEAAIKRLAIQNHAVKVVDDILPRLLKHGPNKPFRVVIESVTESAEAYGLQPTLNAVLALSGAVRQLGGIALVMLIRGILDPHAEARLRHMADGVIELGVERQGFGLYSYLSITKMRGIQEATRLLLYKETDKGLWLESTRRVF